MNNSDYWHWYPNSNEEGIHFSFALENYAKKFMKRFKTSSIYGVIDVTGRVWYSIKILDQKSPNNEQFTWLNRCKIN